MAIVVPIASSWDSQGVDRAIRDIQRAEGKWGKSRAAIESLEGPAKAMGLGLAAGAAASIKAASDLGETFNAVSKTFGAASDKITEFGETSAKTVGLSQREFQQLATSTGALLTNMGQSQAQAADNTLLLSQRAADMASVFNTDVGTALEAINAGLRGESEPLRAFGVGLSDAALKAEALAMGLYSGKGDLDANTKALATQSLIMKQTSKYAGDFADTSDGAANATRTLQAQTEDLAAGLGEALLPATEDMIGALGRIVGWMKDHETATKVLLGTVTGLTAAILAANAAMKVHATVTLITRNNTVRDTAAKLANVVATNAITAATKAWALATKVLNAAMRLNPIGLVVTAVMLLVGAFVLAYKKSDKFKRIVDKAFAAVGKAVEALKKAFSKAFDWLKANWPLVLGIITGPIGLAVALVVRNWDKIKAAFNKAVKAVTGWLKANWPLILGVITGPIGLAVVLVIKYWDKIKAGVSAAVNAVLNTVRNVFNTIKAVISSTVAAWKQKISDAWAAIKAAVSTAVNAVKNAVTAAFERIKSFVSERVAVMKSNVLAAFNAIKDAPSKLAGAVSAVRDYFGRMVQAVKDKVSAAVSVVKSLPGKITDALSNLGSLLYQKGRDLIQGFIDGIKSMAGRLAGAVKDALPGGSSRMVAPSAWAPPPTGARAAAAPLSARGPVTINITGGDPAANARAIKRALEGHDIRQRGMGARGRPLAAAW